ncbi:hypothetical protein WJX72_010375 [[Myrmecia] bisecta]|uniref:ABC transporter domain-containing protein n=1 Tax=[Myrmecia] bisecta TaxID=41462 RepID=A0AAW1P903_9CHLO
MEPFPGIPREEDDDFAELVRAAREKMAPAVRSKHTVVPPEPGKAAAHADVDVVLLAKLDADQRRRILDRSMCTQDMDNEVLLRKIRARIDRVGIELPKVEVRFKDLTISGQAYASGRALPSILNSYRNFFEGCLQQLRLMRRSKRAVTILDGVSGILKPGRLTLLLGPPGGGKSMLLKALAGKLHEGGGLQIAGEVTYNGHRFDEFVMARTASLVDQVDNHTAELTVRETLDFAARCHGPGYGELAELRRREKEMGIEPEWQIDAFMKASTLKGQRHNIMTDYVLRMLGLEVCADTVIGSAMTRGISGGQRKRVTTGEMVIGPSKTLFADEISTGLDSSTTYQIVRCISNMVHLRDSTVLMALLQPPPETYDLFDDVMLLSDGCIVYHGPREQVLPFFESLGFKLPERKGTADFLQEVTSRKDQQQYWADPSRPYWFIPASEMAEAFQRFPVGADMAAELAQPAERTEKGSSALVHEKYALRFPQSLRACLRRELTLMRRNSFVYVYRIIQVLVAAVFTAILLLHVHIPQNSVPGGRIHMNYIFFTSYFMLVNGFTEITITVNSLKVFYKQRDCRFYTTPAFTLPTTILRLPYSAAVAILWSCITYWAVGMAPDASRFFIFMAVLFLEHQLSVTLFRSIAALVRTMVITNSVSCFACGFVLLLNGFTLPKGRIPDWWIWGYWINPLNYVQRALALNEFHAPKWQGVRYSADPSVSVGTKVLQLYNLDWPGWWIGASIGILLGYIALFNVLVNIAMKFLSAPTDSRRAVEMPQKEALEEGRAGAAGTAAVQHGMILPFDPIIVTFHDVRYFVAVAAEGKSGKHELELLKGISGAFCPHVLTCLMGVSGAGKTTLMDVLAGRKTSGRTMGDVRINGHPQDFRTFARVSGYVEQFDIHSPHTTIKEALWFSARLRLARDVPNTRLRTFLHEVMELVELTPLQHAVVGLPGVSGLAVEQRKRLTIAVELVANPAVVFMDEPTSGLDARAAAIVMRCVRNIASTGRTIVCTIHQPSIDIFESFDELLLLKRGGEVIYNGLLGFQSSAMVDYFQSVPGVVPIPPGYNPATWMLEISTISAEKRIGQDLARVYRDSGLYRQTEELVASNSQPAPGSSPIAFATEYPQPLWAQYLALLAKNTISYWRNPAYNAVRFNFTAVFAFLFGTVFWRTGQSRESQQEVNQIVASQFLAIIFIGFTNAATVQPVVAVERIVYYRERAAGMYAPMPYSLAQGDVEFPYIVIQAVIYACITYFTIYYEISTAKFGWYFLMMLLTMLYYTYYGMMFVNLSPSLQVAAVGFTIFLVVWNLFAGFILPKPMMPPWAAWYTYICPTSWTLYGVTSSQLGDVVGQSITPDDGQSVTVAQFMHQQYGSRHGFLGYVVLILVAFVVVFRVAGIVSLQKLRWQKR